MVKTIFQEKVRILAKQKPAKDFFLLKLASEKIALKARPGQFVEVKIQDSFAPLLRRPLGIHNAGKNNFALLFQVVGKGTEMLAQKSPGEYLDVIGPLGNGFSFRGQGSGFPSTALGTSRVQVLVAGGMGVAPLLFLAQRISGDSKTVLIGAKTKDQLLCEKEFKKLGFEVKVATDDGSKGFKGYVSELLRHSLSTLNSQLSTIYACGPRLMLREVAKLSREFAIPAQVSLEEHMACGIGACLGCAVKTKQGFKRICKDGPVFPAEQIIW